MKFNLIFIVLFFVSCNEETNTDTNEFIEIIDSKYYSKKNKNVTTTYSNDMTLINVFLDLENIKPDSIEFYEVFIDNSEGNDRFTIPGPSDYILTGVIYYSQINIDSIEQLYTTVDWEPSLFNMSKESFSFDWLDEQIINEIKESDFDSSIHPDIFLSKQKKSSLYFLEDKILIKISSI